MLMLPGECFCFDKRICESECEAEARGAPLLTEAVMHVHVVFVPQLHLLLEKLCFHQGQWRNG